MPDDVTALFHQKNNLLSVNINTVTCISLIITLLNYGFHTLKTKKFRNRIVIMVQTTAKKCYSCYSTLPPLLSDRNNKSHI